MLEVMVMNVFLSQNMGITGTDVILAITALSVKSFTPVGNVFIKR
jgi:hypothetical protein